MKRILLIVVSIILLAIGLYVVLVPFVPEVLYVMNASTYDNTSVLSVSEQEIDKSKNKLIIKKISVNGEIIESDSDSALDDGIWHRPNTGNPKEGGNMVLTAHRFKYFPPFGSTFYNLGKLQLGDKVQVIWEGTVYSYIVYDIFTVDANTDASTIEGITDDKILTMYTCTPLWTSKQRLVVRARLVGVFHDLG